MSNRSNIAHWAGGPYAWADDVKGRVAHNDATMSGRLPKASNMKHFDFCHGIHGAARYRAGIKHAASTARRRHERALLDAELNDMFLHELKRADSK